MTSSSYDIYTSECARLCVHPNSALLNVFAMLRLEAMHDLSDPAKGKLQVMQLEHNLLGPRGLLALLPTLSFNSQVLHTLNLSGNRLNNESVYALRNLLYTSFPALRVVDLSGNPFTYRAAKSLAEMAEGLPPAGVPLPVPATAATSSHADEHTPLLVQLKERTAFLGYDNNIAHVLLDHTLLSEVQQACVEQRIRDAIQRREARKTLWQSVLGRQSRLQLERPAPLTSNDSSNIVPTTTITAEAEGAPHVQVVPPPSLLRLPVAAPREDQGLPGISSVVSSHLGDDAVSSGNTPRASVDGLPTAKPPRPRPPLINTPSSAAISGATPPLKSASSNNNVLLSTIQSFTSRLTDEDSPTYLQDTSTALPNYTVTSHATPLVFGSLSATATPYTTPNKVADGKNPARPTLSVPVLSRTDLSGGMMNGADSSSSSSSSSGSEEEEEEEEEEEGDSTDDDEDNNKTHKSSGVLETVTFMEGNKAYHHPMLDKDDANDDYEDDFDDDDDDDHKLSEL